MDVFLYVLAFVYLACVFFSWRLLNADLSDKHLNYFGVALRFCVCCCWPLVSVLWLVWGLVSLMRNRS